MYITIAVRQNNVDVSRKPTDPSFKLPTLIFWGTLGRKCLMENNKTRLYQWMF